MPKSTKTPAKPGPRAAAKSAARNSDSGPSQISLASADLHSQKLAQVQDMAAAMPDNANKAAEHGFRQGTAPPQGTQVEPASRLATGGTLSEANASSKSGGVAPEGENATIGTLDRVRVDSAGRMLTTNQGVAVADNQNSLKDGLRGPVLLEDFILREKITHFDHERIPERIVHARGSGAHGFFECYEPQTDSSRKRGAFQGSWKDHARFRALLDCRRVSAAPRTRRATCAALRSSSIPTRETGTWSVTTSRFSSFRTRSSSPTWSMP